MISISRTRAWRLERCTTFKIRLGTTQVRRQSSQIILQLDGRTRLSSFWTYRSAPDITGEGTNDDGQSLLLKGGFIAQEASGYFHFLPFGLRVQDKLSAIIDVHMRSIGASKLALSSLTSQSLWLQSGRLTQPLEAGNHELLAVRDRKDSSMLLAPTHEEVITNFLKPHITSHRDLPVRLYQTTRKYRDELRPRQGLLRTKEFLMKDLYTFDADVESAMETYGAVLGAYHALFKQLGLSYLTAVADSGSIGGTHNHEFHYASLLGEDIVWSCNSCGSAYNEEVLPAVTETSASPSCLKCENKLISNSTIEVAHTFFLSTRYSVPLGLTYQTATPGQAPVPVQMGCYGIGVSRIIAAIASKMAAPTGRRKPRVGLRWPVCVAPFEVLVIPKEEGSAETVYDTIAQSGADVVMDDGPEEFMRKLQHADLIGYPVVVICGKEKAEIRARGIETPVVYVEESVVAETVQRVLEELRAVKHDELSN
ncbi:class II aaRS and biotin synthetase [Microthyrium microscopicum]|uniref:proline--tRNA ligase n=1 Tax=Microthyrium microscopicum TaxID=703497 RepID=A0A6A6U9D0_9PEZI|nr:class II aaRS and biotin synthetase [Microthyrium microscopicum]